MPKAVSLTAEALVAPQITPSAATPPRREATPKKADPKEEQVPLQVRLPRAQVRAIKVAAAERDLTISDFMLACFHAHMKTGKHA